MPSTLSFQTIPIHQKAWHRYQFERHSFLSCLDIVWQSVSKSTNIMKTVCNIMLLSVACADLAWWEPYVIGITWNYTLFSNINNWLQYYIEATFMEGRLNTQDGSSFDEFLKWLWHIMSKWRCIVLSGKYSWWIKTGMKNKNCSNLKVISDFSLVIFEQSVS